jgi:hypothetical protein
MAFIYKYNTGRSTKNETQTYGKLNGHIPQNNIYYAHCKLPHVRVGAGNDLLRLSDMLDTWPTNY